MRRAVPRPSRRARTRTLRPILSDWTALEALDRYGRDCLVCGAPGEAWHHVITQQWLRLLPAGVFELCDELDSGVPGRPARAFVERTYPGSRKWREEEVA